MVGIVPLADGSGKLPALETACPECSGTGRIEPRQERNRWTSGGSCGHCQGAGALATEDGERLLSFLRRNRVG